MGCCGAVDAARCEGACHRLKAVGASLVRIGRGIPETEPAEELLQDGIEGWDACCYDAEGCLHLGPKGNECPLPF